MLEAFVASFFVALISEIADKTQLVVLGIALEFKSPLKVFFGALLAHSFMDGIAIAFGSSFGFLLSSTLVKSVIGILFIALGLWGFAKFFIKKGKKEEKKPTGKNAFLASFLLVTFSEFGDKTQIASGLLAAKYADPIIIFLGFTLGLAVTIGLNVFIGTKFAEKLPRKAIKIATSVIYILFGLVSLFF